MGRCGGGGAGYQARLAPQHPWWLDMAQLADRLLGMSTLAVHVAPGCVWVWASGMWLRGIAYLPADSHWLAEGLSAGSSHTSGCQNLPASHAKVRQRPAGLE